MQKIAKNIIVIMTIILIALILCSSCFELCTTKITITSLCCYSFCFALILLIPVLIVTKMKRFVKLISIISLSIIICLTLAINRDMSLKCTEYQVYTNNNCSIFVCINESIFGNRCNVYLKKNSLIMRKVGNPMALPNNYDPVKSKNLQVVCENDLVVIKIKCSGESEDYEEIKVTL